MRSEHSDLVEHLKDEELLQVLTLPVVLGMLVEARLHHVESPAPVVPLDETKPEISDTRTQLSLWWEKLRQGLAALMRRIRGQTP